MARPKGSTGRKQLTTIDRHQIRTLYFDGHLSQAEIRDITKFTPDQIRTAIRAESDNPKPRAGRPQTMTKDQQEEMVDFVTASKENRRMSYLQLSMVLFGGIFGTWVIKHTLWRLGFRRRVARRKPPISEKNRQLRLEWAQTHKDWTFEQWMRILWSDETWITGGTHRKVYVTRREGEECDPTCIVERPQRKAGWMFWGCFYGIEKGPGIFWEKDWGSINAESYRAHIVPVIHGWITLKLREGCSLVLMQDNAPGHASRETKEDLEERGVPVIQWPPYSPDLNPIETCWNWMKDYIEDKWGIEQNTSYDNLREYVNEAWRELPEDFLEELLRKMPDRCQAVIDANGMHTKY